MTLLWICHIYNKTPNFPIKSFHSSSYVIHLHIHGITELLGSEGTILSETSCILVFGSLSCSWAPLGRVWHHPLGIYIWDICICFVHNIPPQNYLIFATILSCKDGMMTKIYLKSLDWLETEKNPTYNDSIYSVIIRMFLSLFFCCFISFVLLYILYFKILKSQLFEASS